MQGRGLPVESPRDAPWGERWIRTGTSSALRSCCLGDSVERAGRHSACLRFPSA
jgi:hypothetical protein